VTFCHWPSWHTDGILAPVGQVITSEKFVGHGVFGCGATGSAVAIAGESNSASVARAVAKHFTD
jgi:hypothetical protein